jgi:serine/threonine protein kinase
VIFGFAESIAFPLFFGLCGTFHCISPELFEDKAQTQKIDIWSLGCIFYEVLTLKKAFNTSNYAAITNFILPNEPSPIGSHVSEELQNLVKQMIKKDPIERICLNEIQSQILSFKTLHSKALYEIRFEEAMKYYLNEFSSEKGKRK